MAEFCITLHGDRPSFRAKDGPITARVEVPGGTDAYCFDPERSRCRLEAIPRPDPHKWTDPAGLLAMARGGELGLRVLEDRLPSPPLPPPFRRGPGAARGRRPHLPRDLGSCFVCGRPVLLIRDRKGPGFGLITPCRRMARRIVEVLEAAGVPPVAVRGKGVKAGRDHSRDCLALFAPKAPRKRGRGRPRLPPRPKVPLPWKVAKAKPAP